MQGLVVRELAVIPRARGELIELLSRDTEMASVRHAYLSALYRGEMSGWHHHPRKTETLVCLQGMLKLVLFDDREGSPTRGELRELFVGEHNPCSVSIPPGLKHAARAYGGEKALVLVFSDLPAPEALEDKVEDAPPLDYDWSLKIT